MPAPSQSDRARCFGGFTVLTGGMSGAAAPSLIDRSQYASAVNYTVRGDYLKTRPPYANLIITFPDDNGVTASRFTGRFQGALWYDGALGQSGHIISRGGKLFKLTLGMQNVLTEITPVLLIQTTAAFIVPSAGDTVLVDVTSESALTTGDTIYIDSGEYTVTNRFTNQLLLTYAGGAANATAPSGSGLLDSAQTQIKEFRTNPATMELVFMLQANSYLLVFAGQHKTVIYDGSHSRLAGPNEVPPGVFAAYGWGRIWVTRPNRRTFVAGDIDFGPSGTPQAGYRDAILKFTENDFLNEGGDFGVPHDAGPITSMQFLATQDTSLGIGVLLVGTTNAVFSVNAPVDRTTWKNLRYPIQTISLLDYGPTGPRFAVPADGDMWHRSLDGFRSFIVARRNFPAPGNTPMSREIEPLLAYDTPELLYFGCGIHFDNKLFFTMSPSRTSDGIRHAALAVLNADLLSDLRGKQAPAWEGAYSGLQMFQVVKGRINDTERAFAWADNDGTFELWELLKQGHYDEYSTVEDEVITINRTPIQAAMETRADDFQLPFDLKTLYMGELYVDQIVDNVTIRILYRPDQYPCWTEWATLRFCANVSQCTLTGAATCSVWRENKLGYAARITLPQPRSHCIETKQLVNRGYEFQWRFESAGHFRLRKFRAHAKVDTVPMEGECPPETVQCVTINCCEPRLLDYDAHNSLPPTPPPPITYLNAMQCVSCGEGSDVNHTTIPTDANGISVTDGVVCAAAGHFPASTQEAADAAAYAAAQAKFNELVEAGTILCGSGACVDGNYQSDVRENEGGIGFTQSFLIGLTYDPVNKKLFVGGQGHILVFDAENPGTAPTLVDWGDGSNTVLGIVFNPVNNLIYFAGENSKLYTLDPVSLVVTEIYDFGSAFLVENFGHSMLVDGTRNQILMFGYVPTSSTNAGFIVFNCDTNTVAFSHNFGDSATNSYGGVGCYCGSNDRFYIFTRNDAATGQIFKLHPDTFALTELPLGIVPEDNSYPIWISQKNQIYFGAVIGGSGSDSSWAVLDCATDTILFGPGSDVIGWAAFAYHPGQDRVYATTFNASALGLTVSLIDPDTNLIEQSSQLDPASTFVSSALYIPVGPGQIWMVNNQGGASDPGRIWAFSNCSYSSTEQTAECPEGTTGDSVTKDAGDKTSLISQADADAQALAAAEAELECAPDSSDPDWAPYNLPEPTGGNNISADTAANASGGGSFTGLGPIGLTEADPDDMSTGLGQTFKLTIPDGWEYDTSGGVTVEKVDDLSGPSTGSDITAISVSVTSSTVTVTLSVVGNTRLDRFIIRGLKVRPIDGATVDTAVGFILNVSWDPGTLVFNGILPDLSTFGLLNMVPGTPTQLAITQQPSVTATVNVAFATQPIVQTRDQFNNWCYNEGATNITATRLAGTGTLAGQTVVSTIGGEANWSDTAQVPALQRLKHNTASTITIQFTAPGLTSVTSNNIVVS